MHYKNIVIAETQMFYIQVLHSCFTLNPAQFKDEFLKRTFIWIVYRVVFKVTIDQFVSFSDNFPVCKIKHFANCID